MSAVPNPGFRVYSLYRIKGLGLLEPAALKILRSSEMCGLIEGWALEGIQPTPFIAAHAYL